MSSAQDRERSTLYSAAAQEECGRKGAARYGHSRAGVVNADVPEPMGRRGTGHRGNEFVEEFEAPFEEGLERADRRSCGERYWHRHTNNASGSSTVTVDARP